MQRKRNTEKVEQKTHNKMVGINPNISITIIINVNRLNIQRKIGFPTG